NLTNEDYYAIFHLFTLLYCVRDQERKHPNFLQEHLRTTLANRQFDPKNADQLNKCISDLAVLEKRLTNPARNGGLIYHSTYAYRLHFTTYADSNKDVLPKKNTLFRFQEEEAATVKGLPKALSAHLEDAILRARQRIWNAAFPGKATATVPDVQYLTTVAYVP